MCVHLHSGGTLIKMDNNKSAETARLLHCADEILRIIEDRYRRLFDEAVEGICLADLETGIIQDCNQAFLHLTGYERSELIGQPQSMLYPPENGNPPVSNTIPIPEPENKLKRLVTRSGAIKDVGIKDSVIELNGCKLVQGFFRDITQERREIWERETSLVLLRCSWRQDLGHRKSRGWSNLPFFIASDNRQRKVELWQCKLQYS
jgi:PAS domain S-box-containing protein